MVYPKDGIACNFCGQVHKAQWQIFGLDSSFHICSQCLRQIPVSERLDFAALRKPGVYACNHTIHALRVFLNFGKDGFRGWHATAGRLLYGITVAGLKSISQSQT